MPRSPSAFTDGSQRIGAEQGARIVPIETRGYSSALRGGIAAGRGKYILMGDADGRREAARIYGFSKSRADHLISSLIFRTGRWLQATGLMGI